MNFALLNCHIFWPSFDNQRENYENVPQTFWWRIVTRAFVLVFQLYFNIPHPTRSGFLKKLFFELEDFWDNSILLRQLKSHKKMVVSQAKLTVLISWSPICMSLTLVASTSATIIHNKIESGQPWWNLWMRVKKSDRRPFILILDWILMEVTWIMWMNLFL